MALKEEKAQSMFNKWWSMRRALHVRDPDEPPPVIEDCNSLQECYRWRQTVMKEVGDKVAEIQNAGLGDYKIRVLNDEINKLLNHKRLWEKRIRDLGGPDFSRSEVAIQGSEGKELPGSGGYLYFGAAKDLPGVRELFYERAPAAPEKSRAQIEKGLDPLYFGQQSLTLEDERALEEFGKSARSAAVARWAGSNWGAIRSRFPESENWPASVLEQVLSETDLEDGESAGPGSLPAEEYRRQLEEKRRFLLAEYFPSAPQSEAAQGPGEGDYLLVEEFEGL